MKERRYKEQYRLVNQIDERTGRETRIPVYQGKYYQFSLSLKDHGLFSIKCSALCAAVWALMLCYLFLNTPSASCMYVLPLLACALFPAFYWILGCVRLFRVPENMTIVQKEESIGRIVHSALGCAALSILSLIGDIIFLLFGSIDALKELPGLLLLLLIFAVSTISFLFTRRVYANIREIS